METKIKNRLWYLVLALLLLPLLQQKLHLVHSSKLQGNFKDADAARFSLAGWKDGSYQNQEEKYLNDNTGFRADIVRLNNQIDFSLFDICHAVWTMKGKDHYLFQYPYIKAYFGRDYVGYDSIHIKALRLKAIQDTLARMGKSLVLVYLPSKASSYPEYFPPAFDGRKRGTTNYEVYRRVCDSLGINQIDMDAWFMSMKNKSREPLFSRQGIHWSNYGAILGGDSLIRYIERLRNVHVSHPLWNRIEHSSKLRCGDDDIATELNLIFPEAKETMAYPIIQDVPDSGRKKINAIYIGDSYAHKMVEFGIVYKMNDQCEFWKYFDEVHDINNHKFAYIRDYDWKSAIDKADCIVLAYTLFNFEQLGNGFIEQAYGWLKH